MVTSEIRQTHAIVRRQDRNGNGIKLLRSPRNVAKTVLADRIHAGEVAQAQAERGRERDSAKRTGLLTYAPTGIAFPEHGSSGF